MRVIFILLGALFLGLAILSGLYGLLLLAYGYPANHPGPIVSVEAELLALVLTAMALGLACVWGAVRSPGVWRWLPIAAATATVTFVVAWAFSMSAVMRS
jgi:hypothetical protein